MKPETRLAPLVSRVWWKLALAVCLMLTHTGARADDLPPAPHYYFNDYAHVVDAETASELNGKLEDFEKQTSNQIVVAVYPKLETDDDVAPYCTEVARAWRVGRAKLNNGAVLFVFIQNHKMNIQTGYGLEGALPDITCERIIEDEIAPHFKQGDYAGGLTAGINAMIAATKGEYKGTGRTVADAQAQSGGNAGDWVFIVILILYFLIICLRGTRGVMYGGAGRGLYTGFLLGSLSGGGGGGGGGFSGGGGGFSGGGGSFGGGGASGGW